MNALQFDMNKSTNTIRLMKKKNSPCFISTTPNSLLYNSTNTSRHVLIQQTTIRKFSTRQITIRLIYSVGKHKGFFLQLLKTLLNDIADPYCFEIKQFLANIV
jgi:hypothetical protein